MADLGVPLDLIMPSLESTTSAITDQSDGLSSLSSPLSSKATTPAIENESFVAALGVSPKTSAPYTPSRPPQRTTTTRRKHDVRPRVSIPTDMSSHEYAMESITAAESSRLNPYALHDDEYHMLRDHISHGQVTTYLNIRNGIVRLWMRNPQIAVTRDEAVGCAKDTRWFDVASVCFDWLVRRGFINFGCVHIKSSKNKDPEQPRKRRRVVVIGAGMSGLGCARQLEGLFTQYSKKFREMGEESPEVVVLEGRARIGGRVYSRAFQTRPEYPEPGFEARRCTAEMGGMIITGFDRGNPMNILVRGQLSLPYHELRSETTIYDTDGRPVDLVRDQLVEKLYNDCLDRVSQYKFKPPAVKAVEGNRELLDEGRDSAAEGQKSISLVEETAAAQPHAPPVAEQGLKPQANLVPVSTDNLTGRVHEEVGRPTIERAGAKAKAMGWTLRTEVADEQDLNLQPAAQLPGATLGSVVDDAISQYADIVKLTAEDYRLLNWHIANLEYSNAINYGQLSLQGWDIDAGNEWEGKHTMVVGGYQSVARGLMLCPTPLNVRLASAVRKISYAPEDGPSKPVTVECEDGHTVEADFVVNTIPLGVLKHGNVTFDPPLPAWKTEAIERLGFGVLNKVVLIFKEAFWDPERDIFGVLRRPDNPGSLSQQDYSSPRGRLFQWFNVSNTTGLPCLVALMAGDAAFDVEKTPNAPLVAEATAVLRSVFGKHVPDPIEAVVTRWASDRFARGSYSSAGPQMDVDDYDIMARPLGNLLFAGEHTIGTHPATVHGAYLSGLAAAGNVLEAMLGPLEVPVPLVIPRETPMSLKRKALEENKDPTQARLEAYDLEVWDYIVSKIGYRPLKPVKPAMNAFVIYSKANFDAARVKCEAGRRPGSKGRLKPSANEIRAVTAKMWKDISVEEKKPFEAQAEEQKAAFAATLKDFDGKAAAWDQQALELRAAYEKEHPSLPGPDELVALVEKQNRERRGRMIGSYAEENSDVEML
jgi:vacuolar protein sorting-associated protein 33A